MIKLNELSEKYIAAAIGHGESIETGDHKTANKQYRVLKEVYVFLDKDDKKDAKDFYRGLLKDDNEHVATWASAHCLGLDILANKSKKTLSRIAKKGKTGMIRFDAEMTLDTWKEQGYLKF